MISANNFVACPFVGGVPPCQRTWGFNVSTVRLSKAVSCLAFILLDFGRLISRFVVANDRWAVSAGGKRRRRGKHTCSAENFSKQSMSQSVVGYVGRMSRLRTSKMCSAPLYGPCTLAVGLFAPRLSP